MHYDTLTSIKVLALCVNDTILTPSKTSTLCYTECDRH